MSILLWTVLTTSLVGSLHCAGMCGPFVAFYSGTCRAGKWPHVAYNGGRLLVYTALGATAGAVGQALDLAGRAAHVSQIAALIGGACVVAWGAVALVRALGVRLPAVVGVDDAAGGAAGVIPSERLVRLGRRSSRVRPGVRRAGALGLLTGALPCGWLYAFVLAAAATGSAVAGGLVMATFWLGTVPMMLGLGLFTRRIARAFGRRLPVVTALLLVAVGVAALVHRAPMIGVLDANGNQADSQQITQEPACHGRE